MVTVSRVVIVTGLSGAGRRTAVHTMEDLGWYVVDNLPPTMLRHLYDTAKERGIEHLAVVLDVRTREMFEGIGEAFAELEALGINREILFIEARDEIIVRRQESSRRPLPLQGNGRLLDGIARERRMLSELRQIADMVIDTSDMNVRQLGKRIQAAYGGDEPLRITAISFGIKNGAPIDADLVLDVRFLPNPFWVPDLRPMTGLSEAVSSYVLSQSGAQEFLDRATGLIGTVSTGYLEEGKRQMTLAIGCTGGKHRSTAMTMEVARRLRDMGHYVTVMHRDLGRE
ncbi:MAG: RNase adapter RapZ [Propionibacterium sp.]|nr:MAG: RNase adapter RapZ [Propionibacterium sp.]